MSDFDLEGDFQTLVVEQEKQQDKLLQKPNVVGVAVGNRMKNGVYREEPCLTVFVTQKLDKDLLKPEDVIDNDFTGVETDVVETGEIFAGAQATRTRPAAAPPKELPPETAVPRMPFLTEPRGANGTFAVSEPVVWQPEEVIREEIGVEILKQRKRPVEGGFSVGHYRVTAGTMATAVYDQSAFPGIPQNYYILSNNHVLANSNAARIGDPILQPGRYDGGVLPGDMIARLSRFVPIRFGGPANYVDAAIAKADFHDIDREIYWIGYLRGVRVLRKIGEFVQKTGRTTNYTTGKVTHLNATVNVNYGGGRVARMVRQIITTNMSAPGDSGSCLCDMNGNAVGLLFAGSSQVTVHNHMIYVMRLLGIRIV